MCLRFGAACAIVIGLFTQPASLTAQEASQETTRQEKAKADETAKLY